MSNPHLLLLGPPGAGKGTQSERVATEYDVEHVTTGDALRANKGMDISDLDLEYDTPGEYMDSGELVPDPVVDEIVAEALSSAGGYVLDGYPRNESQAEYLDSITDLDLVAFLAVEESTIVDRLTDRRLDPETGDIYHLRFDPPDSEEIEERLVQREDDTEETVRERVRVYRENTEPLIERYESAGLLEEIDGEGTPEEVWEDLDATIENAIR